MLRHLSMLAVSLAVVLSPVSPSPTPIVPDGCEPPDVRGQELQVASETLRNVPDADINIQVFPQTLLPTSTSYVIDYVVEDCSADRGFAAQDDVVYTVVLTVGPKVPDVRGLSRTDAETALDAAGLGKDPQPANASTGWKVTRQDPPADRLVSFGTTVRIDLVSPNPPPPEVVIPPPPPVRPGRQVTVPSLIGLDPAAATLRLSEAGLVLSVDPDSPETGKIDRQNPVADSQVAEGATVTVSLREAVTETLNPDDGGNETGPGEIPGTGNGSSSPLIPVALVGIVLPGLAIVLIVVLVARTLRARRTVRGSDPQQASSPAPASASAQTLPYPQLPPQTQPQQVPSIHCDPHPDPAPRLEIHLTGSPPPGAAPSAPVPDIRVELFADPGRQELREVVS
ncbi:PASTA domain-containing protein [Streptosporangium subroseum]|uniref:PASTA domain-containing protein n=1 Tax=Streptosporangium subroseum TaxID=106412 RepID=A0A239AM10_9ACTN|nr:PASTA domain-containing protein [Streptosporangium subroseum]SNR96401.1 PASTA domain-containing protein [Streptosporangium subroseum]